MQVLSLNLNLIKIECIQWFMFCKFFFKIQINKFIHLLLLFSVINSCPTLCDPRIAAHSVLHYLPEFAQIDVQCVDDTI